MGRKMNPVVPGLACTVLILMPAVATAQINFQKTGYYLAMGDSVSVGEGALPVTHGFVYQLYDQGVFGMTQDMDFGNIAIMGATTDVVQMFQVPQVLCQVGHVPSVITITIGANDFFVYIATNGVPANPLVTIPAVADTIAAKTERIIRSLVFGLPGLPAYCAGSGIPGITVLVSNYYSFDHPDPQIDFVLDLALETFGSSLSARIAQIRAEIQAAGRTARIALVDTRSAMEGRGGLLLIERRFGFGGGFDFEVHPTNAGHTAIAREFEAVWKGLQ